jgi:CzcA family heavy metal efflux pump
MKTAIAFAIRNRLFVITLAVFALALGVYFIPRLPVDVLPDINDPTVVIMTEAPGLPPEEVETQVTRPIESALNYAPHLKRLRSSSGVGLSIVNAEFDWGTDIFLARQIVSEKLQLAAEELPEGVRPPVMGPITSRLGEIVEYVLEDETGRFTLMNMREIADRVVAPQLRAIPGVADVLHMGGFVPQFQILVDSQKLLDFRLTLESFLAAVDAANVYASGGFLTEGPIEYQIHGLGRAYALEDFEKAVVLPYGGVTTRSKEEVPVTVESIADAALGPELRRGAASFNGKEAVLGKIAKSPSVNTLAVTEKILQAFKNLNLKGVKVFPIYLQRDLIKRAVDNVLKALYEGAALVVLILIAFLLRLRPMVISLISIPLSLVLTVLVLYWMGLSMNIMTLGGLAIAVGMVVDDSIIDVENTNRRLLEHFRMPKPGVSSEQVTLAATVEIRNSVFFATAIILLVFIPLLNLGGIEGRMFAPLGITVITAMICSLVISLFVTPALCQLLLTGKKRAKEKESITLRLTKRLYRPVVDFAIAFRLPVILVTLALVGVTIFLSLRLGREFIPTMDEGALVVNALLSPGTSLDESFSIAQRIEQRLLEVPGVTSVATRTGRAARDEHAEGVYYNEILVNILPPEKRKTTVEEIKAEIRKKLVDFPGLSVSIGQPISHRLDHLLSGVQAQIAVKIFGPSLAVLREKAEEVRAAAEKVPGVADLMVEPQVEIPKLRIDLDREGLALYGFTALEVVDFANVAFNGKVVGQVVSGPMKYDVLVRLKDEERENIDRILELRMENQLGEFVPLKELANIYKRSGPSTILRENMQRRIVVQCNVRGRDLGSTASEIEARVRESAKLPEGYSIAYGGQWESRKQAMHSLTFQLIFVIAGMFFLLFFGLGSIRLSVMVLLNIPLAVMGGVASVYLSSGVLSVSSAVGFILLFGIAIRNGIILLGHINDLRFKEGMELVEATRKGAMERISPVLMTAISTGLGMLPLAVASGSGAEIQKPLATVIMGGMFTSTLLTLIVLPALYVLAEKAFLILRRRPEIE